MKVGTEAFYDFLGEFTFTREDKRSEGAGTNDLSQIRQLHFRLFHEVLKQLQPGNPMPRFLPAVVVFEEDHECVKVILFTGAEGAFIGYGQTVDDFHGLCVFPVIAQRPEGEFVDQRQVVVAARPVTGSAFSRLGDHKLPFQEPLEYSACVKNKSVNIIP